MSLLIGICLIVAGAAVPQPSVNVSVSLNPPELPYHHQAVFTITVEAPQDADIKLPQMTGKFGGLNVYGQPGYSADSIGNGRKRITQTYVLDPIFMGLYPIAPVTVIVNDKEKITVPSPAVKVRDLTEAEEKAAMQFVDNAGPVDIQRTVFQMWEFRAVVVILALALLAAAFFYLRSRRVVQRFAPPPPPWQVAYGKLKELDAQDWPKLGKYQPYYIELSSILRHYIEDRFSLHAPEQTTPEFLSEASSSGALTQDHQLLLAHFLRHCDRVKFARFEPTQGDMERSFAEVLRFVDETVPKTPEPGEQAA